MQRCPLLEARQSEYPPILTVSQAAEMLQLERHTIYELVRQGKIPAFRAGRVIRLSRDGLLELFQKGNHKGNHSRLPAKPLIRKEK